MAGSASSINVVKGEYLKVLGRNSEIINVGGEKVYPQEVETVIIETFMNPVEKIRLNSIWKIT